jgi:hypothetical protein
MLNLLSTLTTTLASADGAAAGGLLAGGLCMIVFFLIGIAGLVLTIWMLIDAIQNPKLDSTMKLVWALVIILIAPIGAIIYFFVGRNK